MHKSSYRDQAYEVKIYFEPGDDPKKGHHVYEILRDGQEVPERGIVSKNEFLHMDREAVRKGLPAFKHYAKIFHDMVS